MPGKQHQLLAVLPSMKGTVDKLAAETTSTFKNKEHLFTGMLRTLHLFDDEVDDVTEGSEGVPGTVLDKLKYFGRSWAKYVDTLYQIDKTNTRAVSDLHIGGGIIQNVPVTFLMQFDRKLNELRAVLSQIPTHDPKRLWIVDEQAKQVGVYKSAQVKTDKTEKQMQTHVAYPATKEHPAQVETYHKDVKVGEFTTTHWSGMYTSRRKHEVLARLDELQRSIKSSLAKANDIEHDTDRIGNSLFEYVLGEGIGE